MRKLIELACIVAIGSVGIVYVGNKTWRGFGSRRMEVENRIRRLASDIELSSLDNSGLPTIDNVIELIGERVCGSEVIENEECIELERVRRSHWKVEWIIRQPGWWISYSEDNGHLIGKALNDAGTYVPVIEASFKKSEGHYLTRSLMEEGKQ